MVKRRGCAHVTPLGVPQGSWAGLSELIVGVAGPGGPPSCPPHPSHPVPLTIGAFGVRSGLWGQSRTDEGCVGDSSV